MSTEERESIEAQDALDFVRSRRNYNCYVSKARRYVKALQTAQRVLEQAVENRGIGELSGSAPPELQFLPTYADVLDTIKGLVNEKHEFESIAKRLGIAD